LLLETSHPGVFAAGDVARQALSMLIRVIRDLPFFPYPFALSRWPLILSSVATGRHFEEKEHVDASLVCAGPGHDWSGGGAGLGPGPPAAGKR
jgi:hypothetical protein